MAIKASNLKNSSSQGMKGGAEKKVAKKGSKKDPKKVAKKGSKKDSKKVSKKGSKKDSKKDSKKGSKKKVPKKPKVEKPYCGPEKIVPKQYTKFGSMKECAEKKQVKRYGRFQVASKMLDIKKEDKKKEQVKLYKKAAGLKGKVSRIKRLLKNPKLTATESQKLKDEANKYIREINSINTQINNL